MKLPTTDPTSIYRYRDGIYAVDLVTAAIVEFDFFSWLESNPSTITQICEHFSIHERPADVMLTLFQANGWIESRGGVFSNNPIASEHLAEGTEYYIEPYFSSLKERPICQDFIRVLKTDKPANWSGTKEQGDWHESMEEKEFAKYFTAAMDSRGVVLGMKLAEELRKLEVSGYDMESKRNLLDIGGGSGVYASALIQEFENLKGVIVEKEPVDQVAAEFLRKRGNQKKLSVAVRNIFGEAFPSGYEKEFPSGFDVHLFSNVLHDWSEPDVKHLLHASSSTLESGGLLIVHEAFLNREKSGPLPVAEYSTILMHSTEGRCYGIAEMESYIAEAGFEDILHFHTIADRSAFIARKPLSV